MWETSETRQCSSSPALAAYSTAFSLSTGSAPGMPRQTGQQCVFGSAPKVTAQEQNAFVSVLSAMCVSRPITVS